MAVQSDATELLGAIPFGSMIGGPMTAAVEAQAQAAMSSVDFIQTIGFKKSSTGNSVEVRNVTFSFQDGNRTKTLDVPLLTIVPIPFIRIDDLSIEFKASISASTEKAESTTVSKSAQASVEASAQYWFAKAKFKGSVSSKKDSTSTANSKYAVEYTIDVRVHAVQDDVPKGMATVLGILHDSILGSSPQGQATTTTTTT